MGDFRWIDTLGGGTLDVCMPACRVGERTKRLFFVVFAPFHFPGPGDGVYGGYLPSATALLVDTCRWDGRESKLNRSRLRFRH